MHSREDTGLADGSFLALCLRPGAAFLREEMKSKGEVSQWEHSNGVVRETDDGREES